MAEPKTQETPKDGVKRSRKPADVKQPQSWKCKECHRVLAYLDDNRVMMRIKYKDFYVHIKIGEGGEVSTMCRACGALNSVGSL